MRVLTAIVAAVLSVTTGGPLRCPCRLAELIRPTPPATVHDDTVPVSRSCPCHRHAEPDASERQCPERAPERVPCPHGPAFVLTPPPAGAERVGDDSPADEGVALGEHAAFRVVCNRTAALTAAASTHPPPVDHLRYSHAFRC